MKQDDVIKGNIYYSVRSVRFMVGHSDNGTYCRLLNKCDSCNKRFDLSQDNNICLEIRDGIIRSLVR